MLMHMIPHGASANTIRESALEIDCGRKICCCFKELNLCLAFWSNTLPTELTPPSCPHPSHWPSLTCWHGHGDTGVHTKKSYIVPCPYSAIGACLLRKRVNSILQCWCWVLCSHHADFSCCRWLTEWLCLFWTQIAFHEINPFPMRLVSNKRVHHLQMVRVSARAVLCMRFWCGIKQQQQQKAQTAPSPFLNSFKAFHVLRCGT